MMPHSRPGWLLLSALTAVVFLLCCSRVLTAAPPTLAGLTPRGAERGKPVEITVSGANLTSGARLVLPFKATQKLLADAKPNPTQVRFLLQIDPKVPLAVYPVRVATDDGVSSHVLFSVDAFPNINEVEDNSTFDKAQKVPIPVIITGQCAGGDVDYFRFSARRGQRLMIETEAARLGSGILPQIRITDAQRRFLVGDDTQAVRGDCRATLVAPVDGDYVVEVSDSRYRGGNPPFYRLKIADYDVIEEVFPLGGRRGDLATFTLRGGTLASERHVRYRLDDPWGHGTMPLPLDRVMRPGMLSPVVAVGNLPERLWAKTASRDPKALDVLPPVTINSRLEHPGDIDRYQFPVQPGQRFRISVQAQALGSFLDGVLRVTDQAGTQLALVDDVDLPVGPGQPPFRTADPAAEVTVQAPTSLLRVELRDQRQRGGLNFGYRLTIEPAAADFLVHQTAAQANVPRGGSVALTVPVTRRGYLGPIQLTLPDLPPGLSVEGGHVPSNGSAGLLTLSSSAEVRAAPEGPWMLYIEGRSIGVGSEIRQRAEEKVVLSREAGGASTVLTFTRFAAALTSAEPFAVQAPPAAEVVQGYPVAVPVRVTRSKDQAKLAVEVTAAAAGLMAPGQPAPPIAFTIKPGTVAAGASQGSFSLMAPASAADGTLDLLVQGKARIGAADRTVIGPAMSVTVVRPFQVELLTPQLTLKPGQTTAIKGRLRRQPIFKEPVQFQLTALPAGVTLATPARSLSGDWTEFQIDLKVDPKVAPATANLILTCSTSIAGVAYPHPALSIPAQVAALK